MAEEWVPGLLLVALLRLSGSFVSRQPCIHSVVSLSISLNSPEWLRRDSIPKRRLRENRATMHIKDNNTHGVALFSWSLFLGVESLLGNDCIMHLVCYTMLYYDIILYTIM